MYTTLHPWGNPVWSSPGAIIPSPVRDNARLDVAIVGAGFTGLATAHYLLQYCPGLRVAVFESHRVGAGASGRTGGMVLEGTAIGLLPGVEDCIATLQELVHTQAIQCDLHLGGCWEIGRQHASPHSPIHWSDSGTLQVVNAIPGGAFDPCKFLAGMVAVVQQAHGQVFEQTPVTGLDLDARGVRLKIAETTVHSERVVFATNAFCLPLLGLQGMAKNVHTIAVATEPLAAAVFEALGWTSQTPFYTLDQPYLWGRVTAEGRAVIGGGLTAHGEVEHARIDAPATTPLFEHLERRIHGLHPVLRTVRITHRWMGPLCMTSDSKPIIASKHAGRVLIATGYRGHGVALSVRVGKLLAEVLAGHGSLPAWSHQPWEQ